MGLTRRAVLLGGAGAAALPFHARASRWPDRPIQLDDEGRTAPRLPLPVRPQLPLVAVRSAI